MIVRWKVSGYFNEIKRREYKTQNALDAELGNTWRPSADRYFETEAEAISFLLSRAEKAVADAEAEVARLKAKLKALRRKYGAEERR